jgi:hypothetical protein
MGERGSDEGGAIAAQPVSLIDHDVFDEGAKNVVAQNAEYADAGVFQPARENDVRVRDACVNRRSSAMLGPVRLAEQGSDGIGVADIVPDAEGVSLQGSRPSAGSCRRGGRGPRGAA